jgi:hypothetical protein
MSTDREIGRPEGHERFLSNSAEHPATISVLWSPSREPSPTVVVTKGHGLGDVTGESGVRVAMVTNSHARERATRLLELYERAPDSFTPPRETLGSFVIVDPGRRRCILGRDRTAVQHLYSAWVGDTLAVSTRIQPFMNSLCHRLDPIGVELFLAFGTLAPFPLYEGLNALPTGQWLEVDSRATPEGLELDWGRTFWEIEPTEVPDTYERAVERYGELFLASIEDTLEGSSAGLFLSGGSDSACVLGALVQLGVSDIQAVHMHTEGQIGGDFPLVQSLAKAFSFDLSIVDPSGYEGNWMELLDASIDRNPAGSYETFPSFWLLGQQLGRTLPTGSTVYNGEMCLLDQGFNEAASRTRDVRRALFKGGLRRLASIGPVVPGFFRTLSGFVGRGRSKPSAALETGLEFLHAIGRPEYFFSGMKIGVMGMPGAPRSVYRFTQGTPWDTSTAVAERYFKRWSKGLTGPRSVQTMGTLSNAWYSELSNFTMPLRALDEARYGMCFPFSSVELMDFALSLPEPWARDKQIQKDMSCKVLGLPADVAYHQKDHTHVVPASKLVYSQEDLKTIMETIRGHDFGPFQEGVQARLDQTDRGERPYDLVMHRLYCLQRYERAVRGS